MSKILILFILQLVIATTAYDYFKLSLQWPASVCNVARTRCVVPLKQNFTIHGLWPERYKGFPPLAKCNQSNPLDYNQISSLEPLLNEEWPDVIYNNNRSFWKHEWNVHGTCSEARFPQYDYFRTTLNLKHQYDVYGMLTAAGIAPGRNYQSINVMNALRKGFGASSYTILRCNGPRLQQLWEIIICLDATATSLTGCHGPLSPLCDPSISFPS